VPREYDRGRYKARHLLETFFARLEQFRGIATRYDKTRSSSLVGVHRAATATLLN
jgi:transposase